VADALSFSIQCWFGCRGSNLVNGKNKDATRLYRRLGFKTKGVKKEAVKIADSYPLFFWSNCDRVQVILDQNQEVKMAENSQNNLVTTKRGLPVYRVNPSIPPSNGLATRHKRFEVPDGKAAVIVDNTGGEIKGIRRCL
jgi:hypothetical protein